MDVVSLGVFAFAGVCVVGVLDLAPRDARANVAVIFPPWTKSADAMTRTVNAGSTLVSPGRYPFIVIARPDSASFAAGVRRNGGLLLLDAAAIRGCFARRTTASST